MLERWQKLLKYIIQEYVATAEPVGSQLIAKKYFRDLSSATIRNEMAELENRGLIFQPYTSAGRIPTEQGWQIYLKEIEDFSASPEKDFALLLDKISPQAGEYSLKEAAKHLAATSQNAVLVGFTPHNIYYTGLANLFAQPEFHDPRLVYDFSAIIDHLDETINDIFDQVNQKIKILVGTENPFSRHCGVLLASYQVSRRPATLLGILGPLRMDYGRNYRLLNQTIESLAKQNIF
jgi:heat-inducible transcriptional repressor